MPLIKKLLVLALALLAPATWVMAAEAAAGDEVVKMEPFNVTAYHGKIQIIDGFTGKEYRGDNQLVFKFAQSFNQLLLGYHKKLVLDEIRHLQFRLKLGKVFEQEMGKLSAAFGFGTFTLDESQWLRRERAITTRLIREPFFKIKALIVWDLDRLKTLQPDKPQSKYAADIRFNPELGKWERRVTTRWDVMFLTNLNRQGGAFTTEKTQGLNLDTQKGFHYIERGLPVNVPSEAFQEVKLTYPIFYSETQSGEGDLKYWQEMFIANLHFIYDPYSWVARRDTRFRGGYVQDCLGHIQDQRIYVDDRDWFDTVFSRFLSDVVTIRLQGAGEIYSLHMLSKRLGECPRALGLGLDLLNWNKGEKREAVDRPEADARISPGNQAGFRFVMIDAYERFGEPLVEKIKDRLGAQKEKRQRINGQAMLTHVIEELSGMPYAAFAERARLTQEALLARYRQTRSTASQTPKANPVQPAAKPTTDRHGSIPAHRVPSGATSAIDANSHEWNSGRRIRVS